MVLDIEISDWELKKAREFADNQDKRIQELKLTGEQHQYSKNGVPLFSDNTVGSFSY